MCQGPLEEAEGFASSLSFPIESLCILFCARFSSLNVQIVLRFSSICISKEYIYVLDFWSFMPLYIYLVLNLPFYFATRYVHLICSSPPISIFASSLHCKNCATFPFFILFPLDSKYVPTSGDFRSPWSPTSSLIRTRWPTTSSVIRSRWRPRNSLFLTQRLPPAPPTTVCGGLHRFRHIILDTVFEEVGLPSAAYSAPSSSSSSGNTMADGSSAMATSFVNVPIDDGLLIKNLPPVKLKALIVSFFSSFLNFMAHGMLI